MMTTRGMKDRLIDSAMIWRFDIAIVSEQESHWEPNMSSGGRLKDDAQTTLRQKKEKYRRFYALLLAQLLVD